jgi:hypothetical protein
LSRWSKDADIQELIGHIDLENYTEIDRFRDFRLTFSTPAGKRVLATIVKWGHVYHTSMNDNTNCVLFNEGERNLALKILAALTEPIPKQTRSNKQ